MEQQVTIAEYSDFSRAHIARAKLESEGIPCIVITPASNVFGGGVMYSGIQIRVPKEAAEHAYAVLADLDFGEEERMHL